MTDLAFLVIAAATFLLAGTVKGVIGLGLPTVCLGLLTVAADLTTAMALLLVPSFVTNLWQACVGGFGIALIKRLWPFFLAATLAVFIGGQALDAAHLDTLSAILGCLLVAYSVLGLAGARMSLAGRAEFWGGLVFGKINGIFTGLTGSFVVPGVFYLQSIGLQRDQLIQAMGILFTLSTAALAVSLQRNDLLSSELGMMSLAGLIPAAAGMVLGQKVRRQLSEPVFRKVFFAALFLLGLYIFASAVL
ncbi:MAG: sulfite exporter TauE/SafE family protein [Pseudomonadota bacterium]